MKQTEQINLTSAAYVSDLHLKVTVDFSWPGTSLTVVRTLTSTQLAHACRYLDGQLDVS